MIAIIPARGGSKRIPRKNVRLFFGHPMVAYSIAAARRSGLFRNVVVSTEDGEIAQLARRYGADVAIRPDHLATDAAGLVEVAEHALREFGRADDAAFCQLMPNCPLRRGEDILAHWASFSEAKRSFQISVVPFRVVYPQWSLRTEPDGTASWAYGQNLGASQELPTYVCPTGAIWWMRLDAFRRQRQFYGKPLHVELMDANRGIDIDTVDDLALADLIVRGLRDRDGADPLEACE